MARQGLTLGCAVLLVAVGAANARTAAAGACGGFLNVVAPADGKTAPNAALLLVGYSYGGLKIKVLGAGKEIPTTTIDDWPGGTGRCASSYILLRPAKGDWPAGAALDVEVEGYGKYKALIGTVRDTTPPRGALGPVRRPGLFSDERYLPYKGVSDDRGPFVRLTFSIKGYPRAKDLTLALDAAGEILFDKGDVCESVVLTDLAGNTLKFGPEVCK
jgi:hypothetical protein